MNKLYTILMPPLLMLMLVTTGTNGETSPFSSIPRPLGECVLEGDYPIPQTDDPWSTSEIISTSCIEDCGDLCPFERYVTTRGIILAALSGISDEFLTRVVQTMEQMIPEPHNEGQIQMMTAMARKKTMIPVVKGEDFLDNFSPEELEALMDAREKHSTCDIIIEHEPGDRGQPMEVVEHLLHHITMVGLHYLDYDDWGVSRSSTLYGGMTNAIERDLYTVSDYEEEIDDPDVLTRVKMQEYGYWIIATWMDLVEPYGPDGVQNEWIPYTLSLLKNVQADMYALCESDLTGLLAVPTDLDDYYATDYGVSKEDLLPVAVGEKCLPTTDPTTIESSEAGTGPFSASYQLFWAFVAFTVLVYS